MGGPEAVKVTRIDSREPVLRFLALVLIIVFSCVYFTFPNIFLRGDGGDVFAVMTPVVIFGIAQAFCCVFRLYQGLVAFGTTASLLVLIDLVVSFGVLFQDSTALLSATVHWGYYMIGISALLTVPIGLQLYYMNRRSRPMKGEGVGYWMKLALGGMAVFVGLAFILPSFYVMIGGRALLLLWLGGIVLISVVVAAGGLLFSRARVLFRDARTLPAALVLASWGAFGMMNSAVFHYFNLMLTGDMIVGIPIPYLLLSALSFSLGASFTVGFLIFRTS